MWRNRKIVCRALRQTYAIVIALPTSGSASLLDCESSRAAGGVPGRKREAGSAEDFFWRIWAAMNAMGTAKSSTMEKIVRIRIWFFSSTRTLGSPMLTSEQLSSVLWIHLFRCINGTDKYHCRTFAEHRFKWYYFKHGVRGSCLAPCRNHLNVEKCLKSEK